MSACGVENGLQGKPLSTEDPLQNSGLKRMQMVDGNDLGKLLELKAESAAPLPLQNGESAPPATQENGALPSKEFEATEATVKQEEEQVEVTPDAPEETAPSDPVTVKEEARESPEREETPTVTPPPAPDDTSQMKPPLSPKKEPEETNPPSAPPAPSEDVSRKRSMEKDQEAEGSSGSDSDSSRKKNRTEQETENSLTNMPNGSRFPVVDEDRERMISEFLTEVSGSAESIAEAADRLAKEVENLAELAAAKEMEWNTILRVKKLKEEMLERVLRRKRLNHFEHSQFNSEHPVPELANNKVIPGSLQIPPRHPRLADMNRLPQRPILPKPGIYSPASVLGEGRNGTFVDVKSIINDYRSRHPESPARRGRRMRGVPEQRFPSVNPSLISMANMALGTGASVRTVTDHMNFMNAGGVDHTRGEMGPNKEAAMRGSPMVGGNGAKPYPEVTLHPVSPPSLLHQVLTKSGPPRPTNFSPTLARLLTAERPSPQPHFRPPSRVSIADILSSTKLKNLNVSEEMYHTYPSIVLALLREKILDTDCKPVLAADSLKEDEGSKDSEDFFAPKKIYLKKPVPEPSELIPINKKKSSVDLKKTSNTQKSKGSQGLAKAPARKSVASRPPTPMPLYSEEQASEDSSEASSEQEPPPQKKSRNEITITPVSGNAVNKKEEVVCLDDDDNEGSDRLVIDEGGDEVPTCQGCRHKAAQFVCAGCGNQWYCSRECQVNAWEEHSDMCSG